MKKIIRTDKYGRTTANLRERERRYLVWCTFCEAGLELLGKRNVATWKSEHRRRSHGSSPVLFVTKER